MSFCPFMSNGKDRKNWCGCITSCELRINNGCALKILAQKALYDVKQEKSHIEKSKQSVADSSR
mgnify:FL=1